MREIDISTAAAAAGGLKWVLVGVPMGSEAKTTSSLLAEHQFDEEQKLRYALILVHGLSLLKLLLLLTGWLAGRLVGFAMRVPSSASRDLATQS